MEEKILNELYKIKDDKYKEFHSSLCPNLENIIGVRVPLLREYAKKLYKSENIEEILKIESEYYEIIVLQGMLISLDYKNDINRLIKRTEKYIPKITSWAICDIFCSGLKCVKKNKEIFWNFIKTYLESDKEFYIRFGVVILLDYYIEEKYLNDIFKIFDKISSEDYYVEMAIAWAVSICYIKFPIQTKEYLKKCNLSKFTYNKSIQKIIESYRVCEEDKNKLKTMKRV